MCQIVDVHTHVYPRTYLDALATRDELPCVSDRVGDAGLFKIFPDDAGREITPDYWSLESKLDYMDAAGIDRSVVSLGNPWLDPFGAAQSLELADRLNAEMAEYEEATAGRVVAMGCLPSGSVDDVVATIETIAQTRGLYGVATGTRIAGMLFDDPRLEPVWGAFARYGIAVLVHPHYGVGVEETDGYGHALQLALSFPYETTLALTKLVMSGVLDRHPDLRILGSHGGGTLPYLAGRLDGCWSPDSVARSVRELAPSTGFEKLYLDALVYHPRALAAAIELVGVEKVMFGTDHPFAIADPAQNIGAIHAVVADERDRAAVLSGNAIALFGLPATIDAVSLR